MRHTLLLAASPEIAIARSTQRDLPYDPVRDFAPVTMVASVPLVLVVPSAVPAPTPQALVEYLRAYFVSGFKPTVNPSIHQRVTKG